MYSNVQPVSIASLARSKRFDWSAVSGSLKSAAK